MNLEGIRYVLEVLARLFVTGHTSVSVRSLQATRLCSLWVSVLYRASKYTEHGDHGELCNVSFICSI